MELVRSDQVEFEVAKLNANNPADFDLKMNIFGSGTSGQGDTGLADGGLSRSMSDFYKHNQ
jgi:hypothetical protein